MRSKKNREVNIFSASVVDLFASGLGVFLIVAIIALVNQKKTNLEEKSIGTEDIAISEPVEDTEKKLLKSVIVRLEREKAELERAQSQGEQISEQKSLKRSFTEERLVQEKKALEKIKNKLEDNFIKLKAQNKQLIADNKFLAEKVKKSENEENFTFEVGSKIQLSNVQFYAGTDKPIQPYASVEIKKLAKNLNKNPKVKIEVSGHIFLTQKEIKTRENFDKANLSGRRAQLVCNELVLLGVSRSRLRCVGYGGKRYLYLTNDQYSKEAQLNRRVEIEVLAK